MGEWYFHKAPPNKSGVPWVLIEDSREFTDEEWKVIFGISDACAEAYKPLMDLECSIVSRVDENGRIIPPSYN